MNANKQTVVISVYQRLSAVCFGCGCKLRSYRRPYGLFWLNNNCPIFGFAAFAAGSQSIVRLKPDRTLRSSFHLEAKTDKACPEIPEVDIGRLRLAEQRLSLGAVTYLFDFAAFYLNLSLLFCKTLPPRRLLSSRA